MTYSTNPVNQEPAVRWKGNQNQWATNGQPMGNQWATSQPCTSFRHQPTNLQTLQESHQVNTLFHHSTLLFEYIGDFNLTRFWCLSPKSQTMLWCHLSNNEYNRAFWTQHSFKYLFGHKHQNLLRLRLTFQCSQRDHFTLSKSFWRPIRAFRANERELPFIRGVPHHCSNPKCYILLYSIIFYPLSLNLSGTVVNFAYST